MPSAGSVPATMRSRIRRPAVAAHLEVSGGRGTAYWSAAVVGLVPSGFVTRTSTPGEIETGPGGVAARISVSETTVKRVAGAVRS